jgi:crotonobetainyl-CoA:carnitine CoA-transferase CaiB-like acyl-CoA transferase
VAVATLLRNRVFAVDEGSAAGAEAGDLLRRLGAAVASPRRAGDIPSATPPGSVELPGPADPAAAWAASGAMWLTGRPEGPPLVPAAPVAPALHGAAAVLELLTTALGRPVRVDGPALLGERAAFAGFTRQGAVSPGGSSRLLPSADGWLAVNLARDHDVELLPAWLLLPGPAPADSWGAVAAASAAGSAAALAERAQLLGLPAAAVPEPAEAAADTQSAARGQAFPLFPFLVDGHVPHAGDGCGPLSAHAPRWPVAAHRPLVVDLSAMWAGPLCAHLLGLAGARVVKVEATRRPDGARLAPTAFFDLLHAGHESVALDFATRDGVAALRRLVTAADVVIEASRPRAMHQLGLRPEEVLAACPTLTWVSVTGYGRSGPWSDRVAFGDDAAAAAGLVATDDRGPVFCADAVADPVSGVYAAIGALASLLDGGGHLIDVAMRDAAGHLLAGTPHRPAADRRAHPEPGLGWAVEVDGTVWPVTPPRRRSPAGPAAALGADTERVLGELGPPAR